MRIVSALSLALTILFGATASVSAHVRHRALHHSFRHHYVSRNYHRVSHNYRRHHFAGRTYDRHGGYGLVHVHTAAGQITVAADVAGKFKELIAALVAKGFKGDVHCYASGGHVANSLHYSGHACDFAQGGRNRTVSIMYHAGDLIRSAGLRDGCSFHDCGHVDTGFAVASRHRERHYAVYAERRHARARYRLAAYRRQGQGGAYAGMMMYGGDMQSGDVPRARGGRGRYHVAALTYQPDRTTPQ